MNLTDHATGNVTEVSSVKDGHKLADGLKLTNYTIHDGDEVVSRMIDGKEQHSKK